MRHIMHAFTHPVEWLLDRWNDNLTERAVRRYHAAQFRRYRLCAVAEPDPCLSAWYQRMAAHHRRHA